MLIFTSQEQGLGLGFWVLSQEGSWKIERKKRKIMLR